MQSLHGALRPRARPGVLPPPLALGRFTVWENSGSSGEPAVFVQDEPATAVYDALESPRRLHPWLADEADLVIFMHHLTRATDAAYAAAESDIADRAPQGVAVLDVWNKADASGSAAALAGMRCRKVCSSHVHTTCRRCCARNSIRRRQPLSSASERRR